MTEQRIHQQLSLISNRYEISGVIEMGAFGESS